jgi:hypothetical protein
MGTLLSQPAPPPMRQRCCRSGIGAARQGIAVGKASRIE